MVSMNPEEPFKNRLLIPCPSDKTFYTHQGHIIWSVYELVSDVQNMDDYNFVYHVNLDHNKNDFADWIRDVLGDEELAMQLEGITDKKKYLSIIKKRIKKIEGLQHKNNA
jgi:hypothetical protein